MMRLPQIEHEALSNAPMAADSGIRRNAHFVARSAEKRRRVPIRHLTFGSIFTIVRLVASAIHWSSTVFQTETRGS